MNHKQNYFDFQGKRYGIGTIVKFKFGGLYTCQDEIKRCDGVAEFIGGLDSGYLRFKGLVSPGSRYCGLAIFDKPENNIEKIIKPIYYEYKPPWQIALENYSKTHPDRRADIIPGTILYIAAMLIGAIFKGKVLIWIIATYFYLKYLVDIYRD